MKSIARVAAAPLWVARLGTGAKSFVDNPILGSERLNRGSACAATSDARSASLTADAPPRIV